MFHERLGHFVQIQLGQSFDETSAEHNHIRQQQVHRASDRGAEMPRAVAQDLVDDRVARLNRLLDRAATDVGEVRSCNSQDVGSLSAIRGLGDLGRHRQPTGHRFQTASSPAAAQRTIGIHEDVANLQTTRLLATKDASFIDHSAADAGPRKDSEHRPRFHRRSEPVLAIDARIDIVAE